MPTDDPYRLERFVAAQAGGVYERALSELRAGRKRTHWMWFVFPQLAGLGQSPTSRLYAISSLDEARAYLAHPTLGPRLIECAEALLALLDRDAEAVLGPVDAMKLRSSMTLFAATSDNSLFQQVLDAYFRGIPDDRTLRLLERRDP